MSKDRRYDQGEWELGLAAAATARRKSQDPAEMDLVVSLLQAGTGKVDEDAGRAGPAG